MSIEFKGPQDVILDLPQERVTAITGGRGPRRGNLERLLKILAPDHEKARRVSAVPSDSCQSPRVVSAGTHLRVAAP